MLYERKQYLDQLIRKKDNGRIKVITGLRRCGKSFPLWPKAKLHKTTSRNVYTIDRPMSSYPIHFLISILLSPFMIVGLYDNILIQKCVDFFV